MSQVFYLNLPQTRLAYRIYEGKGDAQSPSTALFLHGAGVAGEITWQPIIEHLSQWQRIIVPDLKGMGESYANHGKEEACSIPELTQDMRNLLQALAVTELDLIGYSLGGLVALTLNQSLQSEPMKNPVNVRRMCLLEPASLDRENNQSLIELREKYKVAANTIRETGDVELGVAHFMDGVAPNRRKHPIAEATTQSRLAHRAIGFSYALDAVTDYVGQDSAKAREKLLSQAPATLLLAGELSHQHLKQHYEQIVARYSSWQYQALSACDHSLPFQKPRQIAKKLDKWFFD